MILIFDRDRSDLMTGDPVPNSGSYSKASTIFSAALKL